MANEPALKIDDIFDIDDYLNELEGKDPEVHSGTLRKEDLDDINDRAVELVPEYQPTTTGISLKNLIDIKSNTIDKDNIQDSFSVIFETHLENNGPGVLTLKDAVTFPEKYWDNANTAHKLKDVDSMTLKLDGNRLTNLSYVDNLGFTFNVSGGLEVLVSKYGVTLVGCPVEIIAPEGVFELNGSKSKAINITEVYGTENKPLWLVVPAEVAEAQE